MRHDSEAAEIARSEARKKARKARAGGFPKLLNIPRNWLHQSLTYLDAGEMGFRIVVELVELAVVLAGLYNLLPDADPVWLLVSAAVLVHTWNWVTNAMFWAIVIFTFPGLRNPGAARTVDYLNRMADRLRRYPSVTGIAIYGSVTRGKWHDRSDIDMRVLRAPGWRSLWQSGWLIMRERFIAFLARQPMDLYLADDVDYLLRLRSDERPVLLLKRDARLDALYPGNPEQVLTVAHLTGGEPAGQG